MIGTWIACSSLAAFGLYLALCAAFGLHSCRANFDRPVPPGRADTPPAVRPGMESLLRQVAGLYVYRSSGR